MFNRPPREYINHAYVHDLTDPHVNTVSCPSHEYTNYVCPPHEHTNYESQTENREHYDTLDQVI
jgi:hypothetical protein